MSVISTDGIADKALLQQAMLDGLQQAAVANAQSAPAISPVSETEGQQDEAEGGGVRPDISDGAHRRLAIAARLEEIHKQFADAREEARPLFDESVSDEEATPHAVAELDGAVDQQQAKTDREPSGDQQQANGEQSKGEKSLTLEEQRELKELKDRDREVRTHEQAHLAAAGNLATGGASYTYQTGPDGKQYAIGGEVNITLSKGRTPEETASRARQAYRAAVAPAEPSPTDRRVAAKAQRMLQDARGEMREEKVEHKKAQKAATEQQTDGKGVGEKHIGEERVAELSARDPKRGAAAHQTGFFGR
jgi:hypothetical protein